MKNMNLLLRFLLELGVLAALGYWGWHWGTEKAMKVLLVIGAPLLLAVIWGAFGSPKASFALHGWQHLLLEMFVFGSGVWALYASGLVTASMVFAAIVVVNRLLMYIWQQ